jgi:hypothetical protein
VIDIANPSSPQIVGSVSTPSTAYGVAISNAHAYVADEFYGLQVIDIADPQNPQIVGSVSMPGIAWDVAVSGTHAYVAAGLGGGLQVIDIADPQNPQVVGSVNTPAEAYGVVVSGSAAYVADVFGALVVDITDPQNPVVVGGRATNGARGVAVSGTQLYISGYSLQILPLQCASTPVFLTSFTLTRHERVVEIRWAIHQSVDGGEFRLTAVRGEEHWDVPLDSQRGLDFVAFDRSSKLADGGEVLYRLAYRGPGQDWLVLAAQLVAVGSARPPMRLLDPYPNPARMRVVIPYSIGVEGPVRLTVHDVAGREVTRIFEGSLRPGAGQWMWSGQGAGRNRALAAGVYVVRLATEQGVQTRKVTLLD